MDETTQRTLHQTLHHAMTYLDGLDHRSVAATVGLSTLRARLLKPLQEDSIPPDRVIDELVADVEGGILGSAGGRFFAWVVGGALPAALAADWLTAAWDQNAGIYAGGPAAAITEEAVGSWIKDLLGLPAAASFALTSGCQLAHTTCLAAARHYLLSRQGWDVEELGLFGAPALRILTSQERHGSIERAVRILGIGTRNIIDLPVDAQGCLEAATLQQALLSEPPAPTIVLLQAGDLNIGAFDDFASLIPIAKAQQAWVHVDGAFGLWTAVSPQHLHLVKGVEQADSWATDGHKWLNVPYDCGYAFVANAEAHRAAMSHRASYLTHDSEARDQIDWNAEWSRRSRGFSSYAALRQLGRSGLADLVERCCRHARALVQGIGALPGAEIVWEPQINQGLVRFLDPSPTADAASHDLYTDRVIAEVLQTGEVFFGGTTWRGHRAMRVSVCNWRTSDADVLRSIAAVRQVVTKGV